MKTLNLRFAILIAIITIGYVNGCAQDPTPKIDDKVRAEQISGMKFGMFICWSFSTFSGQEWTPTEGKDASYFKATGCNTDALVTAVVTGSFEKITLWLFFCQSKIRKVNPKVHGIFIAQVFAHGIECKGIEKQTVGGNGIYLF